ncbi:MAG: 2-hydroxyhepta-2,4-diene-1,7-dioate isomerase [Chloroflexi bacterium RBG_16_58_14]|nr:MAG: 2-hydroxyhepta-2,4-diene-1,7-dioate isomerase [Chloroflexi bacterium RBG_16_58_14]
MRFVRYLSGDKTPRLGWVLEESVGEIEGSPFSQFQRLGADQPLAAVRLLSPVLPGKIVGVGRNYAAHAREQGVEVPEVPILFLKPPSAVIGPNEAIRLPPQSQQVEHEAELAVVIGKEARWIRPEESLDYVLGYTIANDVTARDLQRRDGQWTRGKGFDTFCPLGPWIETEFDPSDALITCHVQDELRQMASTRDMVFNIRQIIAYTSSIMTLEPGDVILTGSPSGVGPLQAGDTVRITIEGLGALDNPVIQEKSW